MSKSINRYVAAVSAAFFACVAWAADPVTPASAKGVTVVSVEQAQAMVGKAAFYDMRSAVNYGKGHIKGAVALPYDQKSERTEGFDAKKDRFEMSKLPADKSTAIVFYSDGPTGWKSTRPPCSPPGLDTPT